MASDQERARREALAHVEQDAGRVETSSDRTRARALLRYLSAEFKRVTKPPTSTRKPPQDRG